MHRLARCSDGVVSVVRLKYIIVARSPGAPVGDGRATKCTAETDSPPEREGFELSVPRTREDTRHEVRSSLYRRMSRCARRTCHLRTVLLRNLCFEIGRRGRGRGTVLIVFVSSVHNPKIMLGMLIKVLCGDPIAAGRRFPREGNVTFEDLMSCASDFDIRTVTVEGLTSVRYLLPITVGIVADITTIRSAGLSWSHDTCRIDGELDSYRIRAYRETSIVASDGAAPLFYAPPVLSRRYTR
jgi:hypothetical protein